MADLDGARAHKIALTREEARKLFFGGSGTGFPGTAKLARASLRTYENPTAHNDAKSYHTFFHGTPSRATPWIKKFGLRLGALDSSSAACVYCVSPTNLDAAASFAGQEKVEYPAPHQKTVYRTSIVMARVRPGFDAEVPRILRRAWTQSGDSCLSCFGFGKYQYSQVCPGDDMARYLRGNPWGSVGWSSNVAGSDVVGLYPHLYGKKALGKKGFQLWFLVFEADEENKPNPP